MKIVEVRHFNKSYVVFVNNKDDIKRLFTDKRFVLHAKYTDTASKSDGHEFEFSYKGTLKMAKTYVKRLLKGAKQ
jgi:hypothetical protein